MIDSRREFILLPKTYATQLFRVVRHKLRRYIARAVCGTQVSTGISSNKSLALKNHPGNNC